MTLSKKAIRPFQTAFLLAHNILPVSIDYRLCPEVSLLDGPIADVCDAYAWLRTGLPAVLEGKGISVDVGRIVAIGWSTGGHLAMTTAWKSNEAGLKPPAAILSFYGPTDFESGGMLFPSLPGLKSHTNPNLDLDVRRAEMYPERRLSMDTIISSLPTKAVRLPFFVLIRQPILLELLFWLRLCWIVAVLNLSCSFDFLVLCCCFSYSGSSGYGKRYCRAFLLLTLVGHCGGKLAARGDMAQPSTCGML